MVRRWSYINKSYINIFINNNFFYLKKRSKLLNFKSAVSLKRFNKKYTKFKRKALNRIKHLNNWMIYHNIFKYWSNDYCFNKKIFQIQFSKNMFFKNYFFYNFNFNRNTLLPINEWNFIFFNFPKKKNFYIKNVRNGYLNNFYFSSSQLNEYIFLSSAQSNNNLSVNTSGIFFFLNDQKNLFKFSGTDTLQKITINDYFLNLYNIFFFLKIRLLLNYYKIILKVLFL